MAKSAKKNGKPPVRKALTKAGSKGLRKQPAALKVRADLARLADGPDATVLDRLFAVVTERRSADPMISHSARLLSRGRPKVAQKFGEEAVECLIEAVAGNHAALIGESADVLYHLIVLWVASGVDPSEVWAELQRREGVSGIAEKASRTVVETTKIP